MFRYGSLRERRKMSTYIFDFDGTLGNSMPYFTEAMLAIDVSNTRKK